MGNYSVEARQIYGRLTSRDLSACLTKAGSLLAHWKSGVGSFKPCNHGLSLQTQKNDHLFSPVFQEFVQPS